MRRSLLWVSIIFFILLGAITWLRHPRAPKEGSPPAGRSSAKLEAVRSFWEHYNAGTAARMKGDFEQAARSYRKALELEPEHQDARFYLGLSLAALGHYEQAVALLRELTRLYPENNRAWAQLGLLLSTPAPGAELDFEEAAAAFKKTQELNPEHSGSFVSQGLLQLNRGRLDQAADFFAVAADTGAPEGLFFAGLADFLRGRNRPATRRFLQVLEANAREKERSGHGIPSEGDIKRLGQTDKLTAMERAGIEALVFLRWAAHRLGAYPDEVPKAFRVDLSRGRRTRRFASADLPTPLRGRAAFVDYSRDGRPDLLLTGPSGVRLLENRFPRWHDVSQEAGLAASEKTWDVLSFDLDADGWTDVYLVAGGFSGTGRNRLLENHEGRFSDVTSTWGLAGPRPTARALAGDFNGDGRVDLVEVGPATAGAQPLRLFLGGAGRFKESGRELGLEYAGHLVDAATADIDADGRLDLFVLGWKAPARLFRQGPSGFSDVTASSGLQGVGGEGLSAVFFDFDRDDDADLLVTANAPLDLSLRRLLEPELASRRATPRLFANDGSGRFKEVTAELGLDKCYGVVQAVAADFDTDGWPDLLFAQGGLDRWHVEPSLILRNRGGKRFTEWEVLPSPLEPQNALGTAVADVNQDGKQDVVLPPAGLFIQQQESP